MAYDYDHEDPMLDEIRESGGDIIDSIAQLVAVVIGVAVAIGAFVFILLAA